MTESNVVFSPSSNHGEIYSDLQRVDSHVIRPEEYDEIPEITEEDLANAVIRRPGKPDQPFADQPAQGP